jgi:hypothetical protein
MDTNVALGIIYKLFPIDQINDDFKKSALILKIDKEKKNGEGFSIHPKFECFNRDADDLHRNFKEGDSVEVDIISGRLYTSKKTGEEDSFTGLRAWNVTKLPTEAEVKVDAPVADPPADNKDSDELPF